MLVDPGDPGGAARRRDRMLADAEGRLADAAGAAVRQFLRTLRRWLDTETLTAAVPAPRTVELFTLGQAVRWWETALDTHVVADVRRVWEDGWRDTSDLAITPARGQEDYVARVRDRLSVAATPTLPERAFDTTRVALADEMARGSSMRDISRRVAQDLGWDADATLARERLDVLNRQIGDVLDPLGPPGAPAREAARLNDPQVARWQAQRAEQVKVIDRTQSEWQTRATAIARTETVGAYNAGSLDAALVEAVGFKVWMATGDDRTRDTHLDASGQCVGVRDAFTVGGSALMMPGDPSGPASEVVMCRCTMVYSDTCGQAAERFSRSAATIDAERGRRDV